MLRGNGDGTFQNSGVGYVTTGYSRALVAGDFHGDGLPDLAISSSSLGVPGLVDDVMILGNEGRGAADQLTPRRERSRGAPARRRIECASASLGVQEVMTAASRATAVSPARALPLADESWPLLGRGAEGLSACAAPPAARGPKPTQQLALALVRSRANQAALWLIDRVFAESDGDGL